MVINSLLISSENVREFSSSSVWICSHEFSTSEEKRNSDAYFATWLSSFADSLSSNPYEISSSNFSSYDSSDDSSGEIKMISFAFLIKFIFCRNFLLILSIYLSLSYSSFLISFKISESDFVMQARLSSFFTSSLKL